jgi:hypothetical protein
MESKEGALCSRKIVAEGLHLLGHFSHAFETAQDSGWYGVLK